MFFKLVKAPETITEDNINAYKKALIFIQDQLKSRSTAYFGGDEPGYADYMIWPWLERLYALQDKYETAKFDGAEYKLLVNTIKNNFTVIIFLIQIGIRLGYCPLAAIVL